MLRNQREERLKLIRRENDRLEELRILAWEEHKVALEKPRFAGWEVHLELSESGKRRRDAADILYLLGLFHMNTPHFVRNLTTIQVLRRAKYSYSRVQVSKKTFLSKYRLDRYYTWRSLNEREYLKLPDYYKGFFTLNKFYGHTYWNPGPHYSLKWNAIPHYELVFKLKKAYWTHMIVFDGEAESDYDRLRHKIYYGDYCADLYKALGHESRRRDCFASKIKGRWNNAITNLRKAANTIGVQDEEWDEIEGVITKKAYNHKRYGWD